MNNKHALNLSLSAQLVFESILAEAQIAVERKMKKGVDVENALNSVSDELSLNEFEFDELNDRVTNKIKNPPINDDTEKNLEEDDTIRNKSIYFESSEQSEQAIQLLMDRSIPWSSKNTESAKPYIQFSDDTTLAEAQSALRRRWDFIENRKRLVADVQFDNLGDYTKVLEYMRRQGMLLEFNGGIELDEDYDELQNRKMIERKIADKEGRIFEDTVEEDPKSFVARTRGYKSSPKIDAVNESKYRTACVRKRWK